MVDILMLLVNFILAMIAWKALHLTRNGALVAGVVGGLIWYGGGFYAWSLLGLFFISSSFWSNYKEERKYHLNQVHEKGSQRDAWQVLANGGVAAFCCLGYRLTESPSFLIATAVSIAASTADTWASEIGVLSSKPPRSILTMKAIPTGLSGGVSLLGTLSQIIGAALIASYATSYLIIFYRFSFNGIELVGLITGLGILGSIIDSLLGVLLQAKYECFICHLKTEKTVHHDVQTKLIGGVSWLTNDQVNLISNLIVTVLALLSY